MSTFTVHVEGDSYANAAIKTKGNGVVVEVDPELRWDAQGLLMFSEALQGAARMLQSSR